MTVVFSYGCFGGNSSLLTISLHVELKKKTLLVNFNHFQIFQVLFNREKIKKYIIEKKI